MQTITTRFHGATTYKGSRIRATSSDGKYVTVSYNAILTALEQQGTPQTAIYKHCYACKKLLEKLEWDAIGLRMVVTDHDDFNGFTFSFAASTRLVEFRNFESLERPRFEQDKITRPWQSDFYSPSIDRVLKNS